MLIIYLLHRYPKGVQVSYLADALVLLILKGFVLNSYSIAANAGKEINKYKQEDKRYNL